MKCTIPEISWHNKEPVLSVDIFPHIVNNNYRLASGGADCHVLIWEIYIKENGTAGEELITDLTYHQKAVNCVRWFHTGYLASADDDANIIIWRQRSDYNSVIEATSSNTTNKESWMVHKTLRGHKEDIYDLCWSIDGQKLLSGSVDNTAIIWDINKGHIDKIITVHKGFVQGVAWDPNNQFLATISTDKSCRLFDINGKQVLARIRKGKLNNIEPNHELYNEDVHFFHNDTFKSFFRRLQFSPDGSLLIVPSGYIEAENNKESINCTLIFTLNDFKSPAAVLPLERQSSTVVRCCPILFELQKDGPSPYIVLPYRIIFAVGTDHDLFLYDTQLQTPFARFQNLHYTRLTDITWSQDGKLLIASSTDGFCTLITLDEHVLGVRWIEKEIDADVSLKESSPPNYSEDCISAATGGTNENIQEEVIKKPTFMELWATPKKKKKRNSDEKHGTISEINQPGKENLTVESMETDIFPIEEPENTKINGKSRKNEDHHRSDDRAERLVPKRNEEASAAIKEFFNRIPRNQKNYNESENVTKSKQTVNVLIPRRKKRVAENNSADSNLLKLGKSKAKITDNNKIPVNKTKPKDMKEDNTIRLDTIKNGNYDLKLNDNQFNTKPKQNSKKTENLADVANVSTQKNAKQPKPIMPTVSYIDLALEDVTTEAAQDAWICAQDAAAAAVSNQPEVEKIKNCEMHDKTEDFSLHLDDTQTNLSEQKDDKILILNESVIEKPFPPPPPLVAPTKPPRRVALITLSGPKSKIPEK